MSYHQIEQLDASQLTLADLNAIKARGHRIRAQVVGNALRAIKNRLAQF